MLRCMLPRNAETRAVAFIATSQPERALGFYRDTLGLRLLEDTPFAIVFDAFGTVLRVQKVASVEPRPYTSFGLEVPDIEAAVDALGATGVTPMRYPQLEQDALGIWTAPSGARVFWFHDPDENLLSLSEAAGGS
jgi:catechol 2,3-dioxygenase-like lactoylglutathione lyase family enzyme